MLFKHLVRSLILVGVATSTAAAQTNWWFEKSPTRGLSNAGPSGVPQSVDGSAADGSQKPIWFPIPINGTRSVATASASWIETNKLDAVALQATPTKPKILSEKSPIPDKALERKSMSTASESFGWTPRPPIIQINQPDSKEVHPSVTVNPLPDNSFIRRAEAQLLVPQVPIVSPNTKSGWVKKVVRAAEQKISTELSPQALASGDTANPWKWPSAIEPTQEDRSYLSVAANEEVVAEEESLILPTGFSLAMSSVSDEEEEVEQDVEAASNQEPEAVDDAKPDEAIEIAPNKAKFDTNSMVGPLTNAPTLFSMLEVEDHFQTYAEQVQSMRTRDLDSQLYPFTNESYAWISPVFYHKPLYFEQPNLERYGNGTKRWLQPVASSVHFFGAIPLLPYKMLTQHPCEKHYTLGNRRPGNCNPVQRRVILGQSYLGEVREYWRPGSGY